ALEFLVGLATGLLSLAGALFLFALAALFFLAAAAFFLFALLGEFDLVGLALFFFAADIDPRHHVAHSVVVKSTGCGQPFGHLVPGGRELIAQSFHFLNEVFAGKPHETSNFAYTHTHSK